jgi:hypothetical protein
MANKNMDFYGMSHKMSQRDIDALDALACYQSQVASVLNIPSFLVKKSPVEIICPFCEMKFGSLEEMGECPECGETWVMNMVESGQRDSFVVGILWDNGEDPTLAEQRTKKATLPPLQQGLALNHFRYSPPLLKAPQHVIIKGTS